MPKPLCPFAVIYLLISVKAIYNESCGCKLWMCNQYEYNTTEYETCATGDGCIYCQLCSESQPDCSCDTQSICNNPDLSTIQSKQLSSASWWTISIICMLIMSVAFIGVISLQYYRITHHDHEFRRMTIQRRIKAAEGLIEKAKELQNWLDIKDRKWHFRSYPQCFIGSAAVKCMVDLKFVQDDKEAISFGNKLIEFNIIEHVEKEHVFRNEYLFYRFVEGFDDREEDDMKKIWTSCCDGIHIEYEDETDVTSKPQSEKIKADEQV